MWYSDEGYIIFMENTRNLNSSHFLDSIRLLTLENVSAYSGDLCKPWDVLSSKSEGSAQK